MGKLIATCLCSALLVPVAAAHADCNELLKALGNVPPAAVAGSFNGTRCGAWSTDKNASGGLQFVFFVKGGQATYATYEAMRPIITSPVRAEINGNVLTFNFPFDSIHSRGRGSVLFTFTLLRDGSADGVLQFGDWHFASYKQVATAKPFPTSQGGAIK